MCLVASVLWMIYLIKEINQAIYECIKVKIKIVTRINVYKQIDIISRVKE